MTTHKAPVPDSRPLSAQEAKLLSWLLDHGKPSARQYLREVDGLRVVSRCGCGCASIDFIQAPGAPVEVLSDHQWRDADGHLFGVFTFEKQGKLAGLELWSIDGGATPATLPDHSSLVPLEGHAA
jgi:hypothetical protein